MSLNATYSFTCNNAVSNLKIIPEYNDFFEGISDETVAGVYTYKFKPVKQGNTDFKATFTTNTGAPLFTAYTQPIRISSTGSALAGTVLELLFLPSLDKAKPQEKVGIQVIDNKTNDLRVDAELYVDTVAQNISSGTFYFIFEKEKTYHIRAVAPGYNNLVRLIKLTSTQMNLTISHTSTDTDTEISVSTDAPNATLLIDGSKVDNPFKGKLTEGKHTILGSKDGYIDAYANITITQATSVNAPNSFVKGAKYLLTLNKPSNWTLFYLQDLNSVEERVANDSTTSIEFIPQSNGIYRLVADGKEVWRSELKDTSWKWFGIWWVWWVLGVIIIGVVGYIYLANRSTAYEMGGE